MLVIEGNSINEIALKSYDAILNGAVSDNRNSGTMGNIHVQYDVSLILKEVKNRHLYLHGRKNNIFATFAEMFWVMAGREDIDYLMNFIPRANLYSDDGLTWRAAYGSRMYEYGQLQSLIDKFKDDGLYTRQAMLTLWHPEKDTKSMLKEKYNLEKTLDTPCNQWIQFWVDANTNNLNMKVIQRSGDAIFGTLGINLPEFSYLHEMVYQYVKEIYPQVNLGYYNHSVTNFHIYEATSQQAVDVLADDRNKALINCSNNKPAVFPKELEKTKAFFNDICEYIVSERVDYTRLIARLIDIFTYYEVSVFDNITFDYAIFTKIWLMSKRNGFKNATKEENKVYIPDICYDSDDLSQAVSNNCFKNFQATAQSYAY